MYVSVTTVMVAAMQFDIANAQLALPLLKGAVSGAISGALKPSSHLGHLHTLILVDKKTNLLHLAHYENDDSFKIVKTYHTTTGKVKGDKQEEGDLKTPEGVYQFTTKLFPPHLKAKFGYNGVLREFSKRLRPDRGLHRL